MASALKVSAGGGGGGSAWRLSGRTAAGVAGGGGAWTAGVDGGAWTTAGVAGGGSAWRLSGRTPRVATVRGMDGGALRFLPFRLPGGAAAAGLYAGAAGQLSAAATIVGRPAAAAVGRSGTDADGLGRTAAAAAGRLHAGTAAGLAAERRLRRAARRAHGAAAAPVLPVGDRVETFGCRAIEPFESLQIIIRLKLCQNSGKFYQNSSAILNFRGMLNIL